jgi:hypothetical protein
MEQKKENLLLDLINGLQYELQRRAIKATASEIDKYLVGENINSLDDLYKKYMANPYNNFSRDFLQHKLGG